MTGTEKGLLLQQTTEGDYEPTFTRYRVVLHGLPFAATAYSTDGQPAEALEVTLETGLTLPAVDISATFTELVVG